MGQIFGWFLMSLMTVNDMAFSLKLNDHSRAADVLLSYSLDLDSPGIPRSTDAGDSFGFSMAVGDFDHDGLDDLAVGVPGKAFNIGLEDSGSVIIIYGKHKNVPDSSIELIQTLIVDSDGVEADDFFGWSLAAGDFDGDGYDDLAVGSPFEDVTVDFNDPGNTTFQDAGAINVFYGDAQGLATNSDYIYIDTDIVFGGLLVEAGGEYGNSLAVGDFNNDGKDDLVVAAHKYDANPGFPQEVIDAGMIIVYNGHPLGIRGDDRTIISQNNGGIIGIPEVSDQFGTRVAVGNFNNDDYDDLAVGVPYEDYSGEIDAGVVQIIYGESGGLVSDDELWAQDDLTGLLVEANDFFGFTMTTGDLNGDGFDDLLVGSPYEDLNAAVDAGVIHYINGAAGGLSATDNLTISQESGNLFGVPETGDVFGLAITTGDFNLDGYDDVAVGTPFEDTAENQGGITHIIFGDGTTGLNVNDSLHYLSDEVNSNFGFALASGDFGYGETLQIGVPGSESADMDLLAGRVFSVVFENPYVIFETGFEDSNMGRLDQ